MPTSWLDLLRWTLSSATVSVVDRISPCRLANRLPAPLSRVDCPCPWFHANCLSAPFSNQLSFVSLYHFRIRWNFRSKNPLSAFTPKQTKESSHWRATYIVLQVVFVLIYIFFFFSSVNIDTVVQVSVVLLFSVICVSATVRSFPQAHFLTTFRHISRF